MYATPSGWGLLGNFSSTTGNLVYVDPAQGCTYPTNAAAISGNLAMVDRGTCGFAAKADSIQLAGATGIIVCNNSTTFPDTTIVMGGTPTTTISIPAVMVSYNNCLLIKAAIAAGNTVNVTIDPLTPASSTCADAQQIYFSGTYHVDTIVAGDHSHTDNAAVTGAAWFTFVAPANGSINISSCGYGVDTRLHVHDGDCTALNLVASNDDYCDLGDGNLYASNLIEVPVTAGTTYYIEWDNRWKSNGFDFDFEFNIQEQYDLRLIDNSGLIFTKLPRTQYPLSGLPYSVDAANIGFGDLTNVTVNVNLYDGGGNTVSTSNGSIAALAAGDTTAVNGTLAVSALPTIGNYSMEMAGNADEALANVTDDVVFNSFEVTQDFYSTDNDNQAGSLGFGQAGVISQGKLFYMFNDDVMQGVQIQHSGLQGDTMSVNVWAFDVNGPSSIVATTGDFQLAASGPALRNYVFSTPLNVTANTYYLVELTNHERTVNTGLGYTSNFRQFENWVNVPGFTTGWAPTETVLTSFAGSYMIRPLMGTGQVYNVTLTVDAQDIVVDAAGMKVAGTFNNWGDSDMTDNGNGTWSYTIAGVPANSQVLYKFKNGSGGWESGLPDCGLSDGFGGYNRYVDVTFGDVNVEKVCFNSCTTCPLEACADANAIFCDNFDGYISGSTTTGQADWWSTWDGTGGPGVVTSEQSNSPNNSMLIDGAIAPAQDVILLTNNVSSGNYDLYWNMYIPSGNSAYYNVQHDVTANAHVFGGEYYFNAGVGQVRFATTDIPVEFTFPHDQWFKVSHKIDIDNDINSIYINDTFVGSYQFSKTGTAGTNNSVLAGIDFYAIDATYKYYVDDITFAQLPAAVAGDECTAAIDIQSLLGGTLNTPVVSDIFNNSNNTTSSNDPTDGWSCFGEPDGSGTAPELNQTIWFSFVGDGQEYTISSTTENTTDPLEDTDTQFALYSGACGTLTPIACNEDAATAATGNYFSELTFPTEQGVTYFLMVDGFSFNGTVSAGEFRLKVTKNTEPIVFKNVIFRVNMNPVLNNNQTISTDGVFVAGNFGDTYPVWNPSGIQMTNIAGTNTYRTTLSLPVGGPYPFKFVNGGQWSGAESVPAECGVNDGSGNINRSYTVIDGTNPDFTTCFGECDFSCPIVSTQDPNLDAGISVYPNPASDYVLVEYLLDQSSDLNIKMINAIGQVVNAKKLGFVQNGTSRLDTSNLPSGVYMIQISNGDKQLTRRISIEK